MILVDTSIWVDHLRKGDVQLHTLLQQGQVIAHPFVIGELAMGNLKNRAALLGAMGNLPRAVTAQDQEVLHFISSRNLFGMGIGYIDAHLLASVKLTPQALLWTRDVRLRNVATQLSLAFLQP